MIDMKNVAWQEEETSHLAVNRIPFEQIPQERKAHGEVEKQSNLFITGEGEFSASLIRLFHVKHRGV